MVESLFVHLTVVPALTVNVAGLKAKLAIDTSVPPEEEEDVVADGAIAGPLVGIAMVGAEIGLAPVTGRDGEQAARIAIEAIAKKINKTFFIITSLSLIPGSAEPFQTYLWRATLPLLLHSMCTLLRQPF